MAIEITDVSKEYFVKGERIEALKKTTLSIRGGEIFGLIGFSGAGKSTLLRLINLLEQPTTGSINVNGTDLGKLAGRDLRIKRQKIGKIFQQFNLIETKTVYQNIEFVLKASSYDKKKVPSRIEELLALVGLGDKMDSYPKNLSGGQKQRVGIARALANDPEVLLCDETTKMILKPLKGYEKRYVCWKCRGKFSYVGIGED
ncbi:ATP-binding cassette domain-containing protein [Salinicoccus sp. CNSTN-B1]